MGYRKLEPKPAPIRRTLENISTPNIIYITNGTKSSFAFPCWYKEILPPVHAHPHNRLVHDFEGWPDPRHPDKSCQRWDFAHKRCFLPGHEYCGIHSEHGGHSRHCDDYLDMRKVFPIHLLKEGYTKAEMIFHPTFATTLSATCEIDNADDWVVRANIHVSHEDYIDKGADIPYTVFIYSPDRTDIVSKGIVRVFPGMQTTSVY